MSALGPGDRVLIIKFQDFGGSGGLSSGYRSEWIRGRRRVATLLIGHVGFDRAGILTIRLPGRRFRLLKLFRANGSAKEYP